MKTNMHILEFCGYYLAFKSLSAATTAMAAIAKGIEIKYDSDYRDFIILPEDEQRLHTRTRLYSGKVAQPKTPQTLRLPAPKRNTVPCPVCENVSVVLGTECQSCGTFVEKPLFG